MTDQEKIRLAGQELITTMKHFMPRGQILALALMLKGEEKVGAAELILRNAEVIKTMPKTYEQDGKGMDAVVYLHYFRGSVDSWITEKDMGDGTDELQLQAFGMTTLTGSKENAEMGYISIEELIENHVELDLYWEPKTIKEVC